MNVFYRQIQFIYSLFSVFTLLIFSFVITTFLFSVLLNENVNAAITLKVAGTSSNWSTVHFSRSGVVVCQYWPCDSHITVSGTSYSGPMWSCECGGVSLSYTKNITLYQISNLNSALEVENTSGVSVKLGTTNGVTGSNTLRLKRDGYILSEVVVSMTADRSWSNVSGDVDILNKKAVVSSLTSAPGASTTHALYVPRSVGNVFRLCPNATTLSDVTASCTNGSLFSGPYPETKTVGSDTVTVSQILVSGVSYWKASGVSGTGGLEEGGNEFNTVRRDSYTYTGSLQSVSTPTGATHMYVKTWGAGGGGGNIGAGGSGGYASGIVPVTTGQQIAIVVGGGGKGGTTYPNLGGYGGGGNSGSQGTQVVGNGGGGGGLSGVFTTSFLQSNSLIVSGGGGGGSHTGTYGGRGGGITGGSAVHSHGTQGGAGTQSSGGGGYSGGTNGSVLTGGVGDTNHTGGSVYSGGGGGGGYYGGGGGSTDAPGGGGSGYCKNTVTDCVLTQGATQTTVNTTDPDYISGVGGGGSVNTNGENGLVVIYWLSENGTKLTNIGVNPANSFPFFGTNLNTGLSVSTSSVDNKFSNLPVRIKTFNTYLLADFIVDLTSSRDWGGAVLGDSSHVSKKVYLNNLQTQSGTTVSYKLYLPRNASDISVVVCPYVTSYEGVTENCEDKYVFVNGSNEYINGNLVSVSTIADGSSLYWSISNLNINVGAMSIATEQRRITNIGYSLSGYNTNGNNISEGLSINNSSNLLVRIKGNDSLTLADIIVDTTTSNLNWGNSVSGDTDLALKKAYINDLEDQSGTSDNYTLYVPRSSEDLEVVVCNSVTSIGDVSEHCNNSIRFNTTNMSTNTLNGRSVLATTVTIDGQSYWKLTNLAGDVGAISIDKPGTRINNVGTGLSGYNISSNRDINQISSTNNSTSTGVRVNKVDGTVLFDVLVNIENDRDWESGVSGDSSIISKKSFVNNITNKTGVSSTYDLYIPKINTDDEVVICPDVNSIIGISESCSNILRLNDNNNSSGNITTSNGTSGVSVSTVNVSGQLYWKVIGINGNAGGMSMADPGQKLINIGSNLTGKNISSDTDISTLLSSNYGSSVGVRLFNNSNIIADILVNLTSNRDWFNYVEGESSIITNKTIIKNLHDRKLYGGNTYYDMYIPKNELDEGLYVCQDAESIGDVSDSCTNSVGIKENEFKSIESSAEVMLTKLAIDGQNYWKLSGVKSTLGAVSVSKLYKKIQNIGVGLSGINMNYNSNITLLSPNNNGSSIPVGILKDDKLIAKVVVNLSESRDWNNSPVIDVDTVNKKSIVKSLLGVDGASSTYDLYLIKSTSDDNVILCTNASNLNSISEECNNGLRFKNGTTKIVNGVSVTLSTEVYNSIIYWKISGLNLNAGAISLDGGDFEPGSNMLTGVPSDDEVEVVKSGKRKVSLKNNGVGGENERVYIKDSSSGYYTARVRLNMKNGNRSYRFASTEIDASNRKTVNKNITTIEGFVGSTYEMLVYKKPSDNKILVCPEAQDLTQINVGCTNGVYFTTGDVATGNNIKQVGSSTVTVTIENLDIASDDMYWVVNGVSGTGGQSFPSNLTITDPLNAELNGSVNEELTFIFSPGVIYNSGDWIEIRFKSVFIGQLSNCTNPITDIDKDGTVDGSFTTLNNEMAIYSFTNSTTRTAEGLIEVCLTIPTNGGTKTHSITLVDSKRNYDGALVYILGDNDIMVTSEVAMELSQNIRNFNDTDDTNECRIGLVSTVSLPNYTNQVDPGQGECGYGIAISTNSRNGFNTYITSNGPMQNVDGHTIPYISNGGNFEQATGAVFGLARVLPANSGGDSSNNFNQIVSVGNENGYSYGTNSNTTANPIPVSPSKVKLFGHNGRMRYIQGSGSDDLTKIILGIRIDTTTPAGKYTQVQSIYTTPIF